MNESDDKDLLLLKQRAKSLAAERINQEQDREAVNVTIFSVANKKFAVESQYIEEVLPLGDITPLPRTPDFIIGIINIRGTIVLLNDLKELFNIQNNDKQDNLQSSRKNYGVILGNKDRVTGFASENVMEVESIQLSALLPPPNTMNATQIEFLYGITKEGVMVLNAGVILASQTLVIDQSQSR